jgi:endonuclease/exonuclease/phosphatase family metal-dependent hydrolase
MKRFLSVFLAVIMVIPLFAFSSGASCGIGDVDGDGVLAAADYLDLKNTITVNGNYSGTQLKLADVNGDGLITSVDLLSLGAAVRGEASIPTHTYNNSCDTTCNYCGEVRTITHKYDNACDASCNVCGATRTPAAHVYTNACDASCNVCGATRTVKHTYDSELDTSCNVCGQTRAINFGSIVVGVNARYIGDGYEAKVKQAFEAYLSANNYTLTIEYRTLGDTTSTTASQLGNIIKTAGDIDVVLAAGNNINSADGANVTVKDKVILLAEYNSDGKRYSALLTEEKGAMLYHNFITGGSYHVHTYDNDDDLTCNVCGAERDPFLQLGSGTNVSFITGYDTSADVAPTISGSSVIFTADSDAKDEFWQISLGGEKLNPNKVYTVQFALYNKVGNIGVGCVRDEYVTGGYGVNTFYGNFADPSLVATHGQNIRARRGFYEIEGKLNNGAYTDFPYSSAYVDADGYINIKLDVKYNGTAYVSTIYYMNKSSNWVAVDTALVGISSSNTFGLYVLHGAASGCITAIKNIKYSVESAGTSYSTTVTTPTLKVVDYNVATGNTYWTATSNWLKSTGADIIGLQEVGWQGTSNGWYAYLRNNLNDTYGDVGTPRQGWDVYSSGNEASPIFYNKNTHALLASGTKWLSSTPDKVGSKITGSGYIRVMTYTMLYHKATGTIYLYVCVHLDNADAGSVRVEQMRIMMDIINDMPHYPVIFSGDLNGGPDSGVVTAIKNTHKYYSLATYAATKHSAETTYTFPDGKCVIDYIFYSDKTKFEAVSYRVCNSSSSCSVYNRSDHYPLIGTFKLK